MKKALSKNCKDWLIALAATILSLLLSVVIVRFVSSVADYVNGDDKKFEFTDIYARVAERRSVAKLSEEVVIASVDGCSRERISQVIDAVNFFSPAAVGLDLFFTYPSEEGLLLANSIRDCEKMILPVAVGRENSHSFFYGDFEASYAAVNMISSSSHDVVREYATSFRSDSLEYASMAQALVEMAGYEVPAADKRHRDISYPSVDFDIIRADELLDENAFPAMEAATRIEGKIVLIGVVDDMSDVHMTPIDEEMPGISIHAHIIDTIIHDKHVHQLPGFWNMFIAFFSCLLFIRLHFFAKARLKDVGELIMSGLQLVLMYIFLVLGANLYIRHGVFADFSLAFVMIGLSFTFVTWIKAGIFIYKKAKKK